LCWRRSVPRADSAGAPTDDGHRDIVSVVYHHTAVGIGCVGRFSGEIIERPGIPGSRYIVDVDVLAIGFDPNAVLDTAAGCAILHVNPVDRIAGDTVDVQSGPGIAGKP
jgi:hypothetical protein